MSFDDVTKASESESAQQSKAPFVPYAQKTPATRLKEWTAKRALLPDPLDILGEHANPEICQLYREARVLSDRLMATLLDLVHIDDFKKRKGEVL